MIIKGSILVIAKDPETIRLLRQKLIGEGGYSVSFETSFDESINLIRQNGFDSVVIKDDDEQSVIEVCSNLRKIVPDCPVIVLMNQEPSASQQAQMLESGVYDYMIFPFPSQRLFFVLDKASELHNAFDSCHKFMSGLRENNAALERQNHLLAKRLEESTKNITRLYEDLRQTYLKTIKVLAHAIEARDPYTHSHSEGVARCAVAIAREVGLSAKEIETISEACELHDLGKIGIQDSILSKEVALDEVEWAEIRKHPMIGAKILEPLTFLNDVIDLVKQHHEHYDGSGYPEGRHDKDILLGARILHLADAYEAMTSARSYRRQALSKEAALKEIIENSGKQFDPKLVEIFLKIAPQI